jgi:predicted ribosome quality control (RQC) complex YloA/Tae2 family protein
MAAGQIRIPYDSLTLAAVVEELQGFVDGKVQGIRQPNEHDVAIGLYARGAEAMLLLSCHPQFARSYLITRRPANQSQPPAFCAALRARMDGSRLVAIRQISGDRVLEIEVEGSQGTHVLIAELMGKHSNLILTEASGRVVSAAKWVGRSKSSRPIQSGVRYERPPVMGRDPGEALLSPFLRKLLAARNQGLEEALADGFHPVLSVGNGAYPVSVEALGLPEFPRSSISVALEQHFNAAIPEHEANTLRASLVAQLERVILARDVALSDLRQAEELGGKAGQMQRTGELILAYGPGAPIGATVLDAYDYEGNAVQINLDPELGFKENANFYFEKAKKAKGRMGLVRDQIARISADRDQVMALLARIEEEPRLDRLRELQEEAKSRRWLTNQPSPTRTKEERPYEGHRIRELVGPGGVQVLYGENAESNDYLTLRVAKPNDYWVHIRGATSAHVVIVTRNHPEKISKEHLMFAAKVAVQNSPSKHSGYVAVDYTLKKYVRKPRGAAKGTALYTHEKTLHVDGDA